MWKILERAYTEIGEKVYVSNCENIIRIRFNDICSI